MPADLHLKPFPQILACEKTATTNIKERFQKKKVVWKEGWVSSGWSFIMGCTVTFFFQPEQSQWLRKRICCLYTDSSVLMLFLWGFQYCLIFNVVFHFVPTNSFSHGGDVAVYVFWDKPTELAHSFLFCCVCFCLFGPFNCISFHEFSWQLSAFSLSSSGLFSALLVLSTIWKSPSALI